tara:strand:+ start:409 stop:621 length:213 start_codon:yes stop_codon:yes gene_type:complete
MTVELKETNLTTDVSESLANEKKPKLDRPNIDHLIKRILTERRKQEKKNIIILIVILAIVSGLVLASFSN